MSRATNQAVSILAVTSGSMGTIEKTGLADAYLPTVEYVHQVADYAISRYPVTGDWGKNYKVMVGVVEKWNACVSGVNPELAIVALVQLGLQSSDDLLRKLRNPVAVELVQPVHEGLLGLSNQLDPEGTAYTAYQEADVLLEKLYGLLGFEP